MCGVTKIGNLVQHFTIKWSNKNENFCSTFHQNLVSAVAPKNGEMKYQISVAAKLEPIIGSTSIKIFNSVNILKIIGQTNDTLAFS